MTKCNFDEGHFFIGWEVERRLAVEKIPLSPVRVAELTKTMYTLARHVDPPLTSVAQPTFEIGRTAATLLIDQIKNQGVFIPQTITLNGKINLRSSSMRLQKPGEPLSKKMVIE